MFVGERVVRLLEQIQKYLTLSFYRSQCAEEAVDSSRCVCSAVELERETVCAKAKFVLSFLELFGLDPGLRRCMLQLIQPKEFLHVIGPSAIINERASL
jgi:hypothetical protein